MKRLLQPIIFGILLMSVESCSRRPPNVTYIIPDGFEGPVVVAFDQKNGGTPHFNGTTYVIEIPANGCAKVKESRNKFGGMPKFISRKGKSEEEIEYLFRRVPEHLPKARNSEMISRQERQEKKFVVNYDNLNTMSLGAIRLKKFIVGKIDDVVTYETSRSWRDCGI